MPLYGRVDQLRLTLACFDLLTSPLLLHTKQNSLTENWFFFFGKTSECKTIEHEKRNEMKNKNSVYSSGDNFATTKCQRYFSSYFV